MLDRKDAGESESCRRNFFSISKRQVARYAPRSASDPRDPNRARKKAKDETLLGLLRDHSLARRRKTCKTRSCARSSRTVRPVRATRQRTFHCDEKRL